MRRRTEQHFVSTVFRPIHSICRATLSMRLFVDSVSCFFLITLPALREMLRVIKT